MNDSKKQISYQLMDMVFMMKHELSAFAEEQGLTMIQLYALIEIDRRRPASMGTIARLMHCDASNITGIIDRLVKRELIVRVENELDRRERFLSLTTDGATIVETSLRMIPGRLFDGRLTDDEVITLSALFSKVNLA